MAFVAANPKFPFSNWRHWNALIAMEGDFVSHWILKAEDELHNTPVPLIIWEQFRSLISDVLLVPSTE